MHLDALDLSGDDPYLLRSLGALYQQWATLTGEERRWQAGDEAFGRAVQLDPHNWEGRGEYGLFLAAWAEAGGGDAHLDGAAEQLCRAVALRPTYEGGWLGLALVYEALDDAEARDDALAAARRAAEQTE
jgi:hypothetical protein